MDFDRQLMDTVQTAFSPHLRAVEAHVEDLEQGIVRISARLMRQMGWRAGGVVLVDAQRQSLGRVWPQRVEDDDPRVVQMDGLMRENTQSGLDDRVRLAAHDPPPALTAQLIPLVRTPIGQHEQEMIRRGLIGRPLSRGDKVAIPLFTRHSTHFVVAGLEPEGAGCLAQPETELRVQEALRSDLLYPQIRYEDIGGLEEELERIREIVELPLRHPRLFARLRIEAPRGVLLHGPPGTGKTTIARALACEVKMHFVHVNGPEVIHKFYGESEARLREIFEEARRRAPSILFIDELDALAPRRSNVAGEVEKRVVGQLLALLDGTIARGEVIVLGATNLPELLDPALRRPGRFDREIAVRPPRRAGRLQILRIHTRGTPLAEDVRLEELAAITHGFVGADLEALCREAGLHTLRRALANGIDLEGKAQNGSAQSAVRETVHPSQEKEPQAETDLERDAQILVTKADFMKAVQGISPTATRELETERPCVHWKDVGGLAEAQETLRLFLEQAQNHPRLYHRAGVKWKGGVLLSGPPGCGKTLLVQALVTESGFNYVPVDAAHLFSRWSGDAEKSLRGTFIKAHQTAPCILFFDGLDLLFPQRGATDATPAENRLSGQLLAELDRLQEHSGVFVIAATNRPERIEPSLRAPWRFGLDIILAPPNHQERREILAVHMRPLPLEAGIDLDALVAQTEGFLGAHLAQLCRQAALEMLREHLAQHGERAEDHAEHLSLRETHFQRALTPLRQALLTSSAS